MLKKFLEFFKGFGSLTGHFKKMAEHNSALAKMHQERADTLKAKHESLPDDHELKAYFGKAAEFHAAVAKMCKEHGEETEKCSKILESAAKLTQDELGKADDPNAAAVAAAPADPNAAPGSTDSLEKRIAGVADKVTAKVLEDFEKSPEIQKRVEEMMLAKFEALFGNKVKPDAVLGTIPGGLNLVQRPGQPTVVDHSKIDPELADMVQL